MRDLQENAVPAEKQNETNFFLYDNTGIRVMFVGNSITRHSPKPDIGWVRDCGMAASDLDHDYVHVLMSKIRQYDPHAAHSICQVAELERRYDEPDVLGHYLKAADFHPDIVIMFFGANVPANKCDDDPEQVALFRQTYRRTRDMLRDGRAKVFHSEGFYIRPALDEAKKQVADECGDGWITLGDIRTREDTHGDFNHPSDLGMVEIAQAFWQVIEPTVKELTQSK